MTPAKQFDYLIVGQGLAGSLLAFFLHQKGKRLLVVDPGLENTASKVAAGIINPITGRRFVKSWRIDDLVPFARQTYLDLEVLLGVPFFKSRNILRTLHNPTELNHWMSRLGDPGFEPYMLPESDPGRWTSLIQAVYAFGEATQAGQVNLSGLLLHFRHWIQTHHLLIEDVFDYEDLDRSSDMLRYRDWSAQSIVFCEGYQAKHNPYFGNLPYEGAKGEVLHISLPGPQPDKMLRHHFFLVPQEDGTYWAGSNYIWRYENDQPTPESRAWLIGQLEKVLNVPYEIIDHKAAIRPTVKDRRPLLGVHPEFPNIFIFNGLGTKGASQGPFFAHHMANYLTAHSPIDPEVDIRRFHAKNH
ncbi:MAG: FAD-binding oxidoreductase [Saprospirales bacterium]|nr:FAD-binding oxidoreductase [Saprospirales bacterium]